MRNEKKEQINSILKLMEEAHVVIKKQIEKQNIQPVLALMEDCQNAVISIGNQIEKTEGTECVTIRLLENYCELIYQLSETLIDIVSEQMNREEQFIDRAYIDKNLNETVQALDKLLGQISDSVQNEITVRKEAVFLPYKASMWDSLESVWKAADEDPNCDAYVIPIPYFDRTSDGGFGELHYEGDLYPKYVPVTDYKEFDFEEHRPDMIFIHNPYDEYNLVTSVHQDFYSSKLKAYTENLIYIPYFVLSEIDPENELAVENMEHFCKTPAVINADKVIVQSEQMKQVYVKVLCEWMGEDTRQKWEDKILGLGSPKFDKVANTKKEDLEIPEEWLRIIEKPDGSWKKIIFYNTSLSAFLKNSDTYLDKVQDVLQIFKENRDEVVLLWRPHPLFMQTLESMRAELKERYIEILQRYKDEGWGIYDESADLDRAIVVSDAYYGDWSSVVQLCQKIEKIVMIQNFNVTHTKEAWNIKDKKIILKSEECALIGSCVYFFSKQVNLLYSYNLETQKTVLISSIPQEKISKERLYSKILYWNEKLILLPLNGEKVWMYDLKIHSWESYALEEKSNCHSLRILQAFIHENKLIMIGTYYPAIVIMNLGNNEIQYIKAPYHQLDKERKYNDCYFRADYVLKDDEIYLASCCTNSVLKFNINNYRWELIKVGKNGNCYSGITWDGEFFWLSPRRNTTIVRWNENKVSEYQLPEALRENKLNFIGVLYENNEIIFPAMNGAFSIISKNNSFGEVELIDEKYFFYKKDEAENIISENKQGFVSIGNGKNRNIKFICEIVSEEMAEILLKLEENQINELFHENEVVGLEQLFVLLNRTKIKSAKDYYLIGGNTWNMITKI